jgi:hypothetical protein
MRAASAARKRQYLWIIATSSALALLLYLGYRYLASTAAQSIFQTIMWGFVSTLFGDVVGFLIARFRDTFPQTTGKIREQFAVNLRESVHKVIDLEIGSHRFEALNEAYIGNRLRELYVHILGTAADPWHAKAMEYLRTIRHLYGQLDAIRSGYLTSIEEIHRQCAQYFTDASKNLDVLNTVAGKIKERAIEPSFELLDQTQRQLEYVKKEIDAVEFA